MDVEYAGSVAPKANIHVYDGEVSSLTNVLSTYTQAINDNRSSVLTCSWGLIESDTISYLLKKQLISSNNPQLFNLLMAQAALQGISNIIISGDHGALLPTVTKIKGRYGTLGYTLKTDDPLSTNPWMTCVGGTSLPVDIDYSKLAKTKGKGIPSFAIALGRVRLPETAWWQGYTLNNLKSLKKARAKTLLKKYPSLLKSFLVGSGGGFSSHYETPFYQEGIAGINTFKAQNYMKEFSRYNFTPPLLTGTGSGRNYPDLSANSSGSTGYTVYQYEKGHSPWIANNGGVSIVAPQFAGVAALINSQSHRLRMGFWNPQLYQLASQKDSPLKPLNSVINNTNGYYTGQPGTIYNQATGLGIPNFGLLYKLYK